MLHFEDFGAGDFWTSSAVVVDRDEMVEFAKRWDPFPMHVDDESAAEQGGLTAPGLFVLAVKQQLAHQLPVPAVIGSFGYDEVRFHHPLRPGNEVHLRSDVVEARPSSSKPDRGIVTFRLSLVRDDGEVLMSHLDTALIRRRPPLS